MVFNDDNARGQALIELQKIGSVLHVARCRLANGSGQLN